MGCFDFMTLAFDLSAVQILCIWYFVNNATKTGGGNLDILDVWPQNGTVVTPTLNFTTLRS